MTGIELRDECEPLITALWAQIGRVERAEDDSHQDSDFVENMNRSLGRPGWTPTKKQAGYVVGLAIRHLSDQFQVDQLRELLQEIKQ